MTELRTGQIGGFATSGFSGLGWLTSQMIHNTLSNLVLLITLVGAVVGLYYTYRINRMKLARQEQEICDHCGGNPDDCPFGSDKPSNCRLKRIKVTVLHPDRPVTKDPIWDKEK